MDSTLQSHIRSLIDDRVSPYVVSNDEIDELAATRRLELYFELLATKDDVTWYCRYNYVDVIRLTDDYEGATGIEPDTSDPIEGCWTFDDDQVSIYVYGYALDLEDIVSRCWLLKADRIDSGLNYSLGDESVDSTSYKQHCVNQYHRYKKSRSGQWQRHR